MRVNIRYLNSTRGTPSLCSSVVYWHALLDILFIRLQFLQFCGLLISTQSVLWFTGRHLMQFCGLSTSDFCTSVVYWSSLYVVLWFTGFTPCSSVVYWPSLHAVMWFTGLRSVQFCSLLAFNPCSSVVYWPSIHAVLWFTGL